jgi:glycosyltransferase involved in cell wall biosynthesis
MGVVEPLVSVVTPVYNDADYLSECVTSVLKQTYTNWDYAIVDNASTDKTPEIAAQFAAHDSRIRHVRFEEFVNSNDNHNRAFRAIDPTSDFCKVVSADDWIFPECLERMVDAARASENIGLVSSYRLSDDGVDLVGLPYWKVCATGREITRQVLLDGPVILGGPSALMFRSDLVRKRDPFLDGRFWAADNEVALWALRQHDLGYVHQVLTFQRRQSGRVFDWALNMATYYPEFIFFHLRYGPWALEPNEYRQKLRLRLRRYMWWHVRQFPRISRLRNAEFFAWHGNITRLILDEGGDDVDVRRAMRFIQGLLAREMLRPGLHRAGAIPPSPGDDVTL